MAALKVGNIEIPIFARFNGQDIELGVIYVPIKINASSVIREAQDALTNNRPTVTVSASPQSQQSDS